MTKFKILFKGIIRKEGNYRRINSTVVLIRNKNKKMIIDPGMDRKILLSCLKKERLKRRSINYVGITHWHPDHSFLASLFPKAVIVTYKYFVLPGGEIIRHGGEISELGIKIIPTPGHTRDHCSFILNSGGKRIAIVGDLFYWREDEDQILKRNFLINKPDPVAIDFSELRKSRQAILNIADFIIPGHGEPFSVKGSIGKI